MISKEYRALIHKIVDGILDAASDEIKENRTSVDINLSTDKGWCALYVHKREAFEITSSEHRFLNEEMDNAPEIIAFMQAVIGDIRKEQEDKN